MILIFFIAFVVLDIMNLKPAVFWRSICFAEVLSEGVSEYISIHMKYVLRDISQKEDIIIHHLVLLRFV